MACDWNSSWAQICGWRGVRSASSRQGDWVLSWLLSRIKKHYNYFELWFILLKSTNLSIRVLGRLLPRLTGRMAVSALPWGSPGKLCLCQRSASCGCDSRRRILSHILSPTAAGKGNPNLGSVLTLFASSYPCTSQCRNKQPQPWPTELGEAKFNFIYVTERVCPSSENMAISKLASCGYSILRACAHQCARVMLILCLSDSLALAQSPALWCAAESEICRDSHPYDILTTSWSKMLVPPSGRLV